MTEELERLMRQARDYPNTATVDLLCEAVRKRLAEMEEITPRSTTAAAECTPRS
jgi:hypothetical protein